MNLVLRDMEKLYHVDEKKHQFHFGVNWIVGKKIVATCINCGIKVW